MRNPLEREHVVLAERVERDVPSQNELVVVLVVGERGGVGRAGRERLGVGRGDSTRCVARVLVVDVLAERGGELGDGALGASSVDLGAASDELESLQAVPVGRDLGDRHAASPPWQVWKSKW